MGELTGIRLLLKQWADWSARPAGLRNSCVLGRLDYRRAGPPGSRIPDGVEMPLAIEVLVAAMAKAENDGLAEEMNVIRLAYKGERFRQSELAIQLGMSLRKFQDMKSRGESYLQGFISADGRIAA